MKQKVLIVKLGFVETIDNNTSWDSISLGDIFRTTAILHLFKNDDVTWLTTKEGVPLLENNPYIKRIIVYELTSVLQLKAEHFDVIVNMEKVPGICAFTDSIAAWKRYGFRFDVGKCVAEAYEGSFEALANSNDPKLRKNIKKHWVEMLYDMLGVKWKGESYILGYKPKTKETHDIGFNVHVGKRWPTKAWPMENWKELEKLIGSKYSVSYQQSLDNVHRYIDWINSCRLLITNDSLGLHLAIALKKKVIVLFGSSSEKEVHLYGLGVALTPPSKLDCMPCFSDKCIQDKNCIDTIEPATIFKHAEALLGRG